MSDAVLVTAPDGPHPYGERGGRRAARPHFPPSSWASSSSPSSPTSTARHSRSSGCCASTARPSSAPPAARRSRCRCAPHDLEPRPGVPGQHLRTAHITERKARRAAHPLPRALRHAHQDAEPHAVPAPAAPRRSRAACGSPRGLVLLYVDVDNFKEINDTFGHAAGDRVLETLSDGPGCARCPRSPWSAAWPATSSRCFVETEDGTRERREQAGALARLLLASVSRPPCTSATTKLEVTVSIGIATCPRDAENVSRLIRDADAAMYHASAPGNCHVFYAPEMNVAAVERLLPFKSSCAARSSVDEFLLRYQRSGTTSNKVVGSRPCCAGACRATRNRTGAVHPARGGIAADLEIGAWVLTRCAATTPRGRRSSPTGTRAINLSG